MSCLCTEGSFFHLLLCAPPFRMSVVGAHENRLVAKANPHGAWDRGICIVNYILTHTQPETSSTCSCLLLSCCIGSALSSPLRQGVCVCVSHAPWSGLSPSAVWFPCLPRDLSSLMGWVKVMILRITWLFHIVGLGARCYVFDSALFSSLKWGCPHPPWRAARRGGKVSCCIRPWPPTPWCLLKPLFAVTLLPRGHGEKVQ